MNDQINGGGDVSYVINVTTVSGGKDVYISEEEFAEWNAAPDQVAARHFGLTVEEYHEWLELHGQALCGKLTKSGRQCNASLRGGTLDAMEWKRRHRKEACHAHEHQ